MLPTVSTPPTVVSDASARDCLRSTSANDRIQTTWCVPPSATTGRSAAQIASWPLTVVASPLRSPQPAPVGLWPATTGLFGLRTIREVLADQEASGTFERQHPARSCRSPVTAFDRLKPARGGHDRPVATVHLLA